MMKQYARYMCSTCFRSTDRLVETKRATIDKCSITLKCPGRMSIIGYLNNAMILPAVASGLENWRPRWESKSTVNTSAIDLVDTSSGISGTLTLAVQLPSTANDASTVDVVFGQQDEKPKEYKQFMFRFDSSFQLISGVESGLEKKALRYTAADDIDVYVNGLIREEGLGASMYQRYNGSNDVPANTIKFNSPITDTSMINQVDVIVSKAKTTAAIKIPFTKNFLNEADSKVSAWKNVRSIEVMQDGKYTSYSLYHFDVIADAGTSAPILKKDSMLVPTSISMNNTPIALSRAMFLFATKPYLHIDRQYSICARLADLDQERDYLKFVVVNGSPQILITSTSVSDVYPPLKVETFVADPVITTSSTGVAQSSINPTSINGPSV